MLLLAISSTTRAETDRWRSYYGRYNSRIAAALICFWIFILFGCAAPGMSQDLIPLRREGDPHQD